MDWIKKKSTLIKIEEQIEYKLSHLQERIWKALEEIPLDEQEQFVKDLRIGALFTTDEDVYVEMQAELLHLAARLSKGLPVSDATGREILKRLSGSINE
jgi:hypothetical protein